MSTSPITRTFEIMGKEVTVSFRMPTNEEMNEHMNQRYATADDKELFKLRSASFDKWCTKIEGGFTKEQILDYHKSSIVFDLFEHVKRKN